MLLARQTKPGWMAVALDAQRVSLAHVVRRDGGRPRVALLDDVPRGGSDTDALARLRRAHGLQRFRCTTALEASAYQFVQLAAPGVPPEEMKTALRWAVKDALDFPADDAVMDLLHVPADGAPAGRAPLVFAVAARRERLADRIQAFQRAGLALRAVDVAEAAQRNVAALLEQPGRGLALLALHAEGGLLTFTRDGELFAARRMEITAAALAGDAGDERRSAALERIGLELQRSLDSFDRQFPQVALQRVVVAATAGVTTLATFLAQNLYLPVEPLDLAEALDLEATPGLADAGAQAAWLPAIGLALRDEA